uniref:Uncharacterized protein n=1 Tax=Oncorhynchus tshawytscha TaxID=74940 RepID=A0A8C8CQL7_ONCTS
PCFRVQSHDEPRPLTARAKELQELRQFDQDWRYGPCTGISRLQQWERAAQHGLNPPQEIRYMLFSADTDYTHWYYDQNSTHTTHKQMHTHSVTHTNAWTFLEKMVPKRFGCPHRIILFWF